MEDGSTTFTKFIYWVITHKTRLAVLGIFGVLLLVFIAFFANNSLVYVDVSASFPAKDITTYAASEKPTTKVGGAGLVVVPRGTTNLIVTSGSYIRTESRIDIPWYGITSKKVILQKDKNADKVPYYSSTGATCAAYRPSFDRLAYYNCSKPIALTEYQPSGKTWVNHMITRMRFSAPPLQPFLGGVMGITYFPTADIVEPGTITAVTESGSIKHYEVPAEIDESVLNSSKVFTNTTSTTDNHFVVVGVDGRIFIGTPGQGTSVDYYPIPAPSKYNQDYNQTLCTVTTVAVYCYQGPTAFGDVSPNFDYSAVAQSRVITYSFADKTVKSVNLTSNLFAVGGIYATASGELFVTYFQQLYRLVKSGEKYATETISQNATAVAAGQKLYYAQAGGIYTVDEKSSITAHQIFYSPNIAPKAIYPVDNKVFIIGTTKSSDSTTYAYSLNFESNNTPGERLIDLLPINDTEGKSANIISSDLIGDKVFIALRLYSRDLTSQEFNIEFSKKKEAALNDLSSLGIRLNESQITFTY